MMMERIRWVWPVMLAVGMGLGGLLGVALWGVYGVAKQDLIAQLEHEAILIERVLGPIRLLQQHPQKRWQAKDQLHSLSVRLGESLQIFTPTGEWWVSSLPSPNAMVALNRSEVRDALQGRLGVAIRPNRVSHGDTLFVVSPIMMDGEVVALIQLGASMSRVHQVVWALGIRLGGVALGVFGLMGVLIWIRSGQLTQSMDDLIQDVEQATPNRDQWWVSEPEVGLFIPLQQAIQSKIRALVSQVEALQNQQTQHQVMLDHLSDGLMVVDDSEIIRLTNQNAARFLQLIPTPEGQSIAAQVRHTHFMALVRRGLAGGYQRDMVIFRDRDDRYFDIECIPIPIGKSGHVMLMIRDMTESVESVLSQHQLIVNVSNRIKAPIARLDDALLTMPPELGVAQSAIKSVRTIVSDLVYLTRLRHAITMQQWSTTNERLDDICQDAVNILKATAEDKGVTVDCERSPVVARLNRATVSQAIIQLLKNAIAYSLAGGTVRVVVGEQNGPTVVIQDFGIGIPSESLPHVFDPFFRINTPKHESVDGGGLGLAIVKTIVDAHDGTIEVSSEWGRGTVITMAFPQ